MQYSADHGREVNHGESRGSKAQWSATELARSQWKDEHCSDGFSEAVLRCAAVEEVTPMAGYSTGTEVLPRTIRV